MLVYDFLNRVLSKVAGCPEQTAVQALMDSAIEICEETSVWNELITPLVLVDNVSEYSLDGDTPTGAQVCTLMAMFGPQGRLTPKTMNQLALMLPAWRTQLGAPYFYNQGTDQTKVKLYPIPFGAAGIQLTPRVAYSPMLDSEELPDILVSKCHETLIAGALFRLMAEPGSPWSNPKLGGYHEGKYRVGKDNLRIEVHLENVGAELVATARPFGF